MQTVQQGFVYWNRPGRILWSNKKLARWPSRTKHMHFKRQLSMVDAIIFDDYIHVT